MIEIIAEIANAHQGSYKTAIRLADKAFLHGADAIKFQIYFADELLVKSTQGIIILLIKVSQLINGTRF